MPKQQIVMTIVYSSYSTHGFNGVRGDQNYGSGSSEAHIPVYSNGLVTT